MSYSSIKQVIDTDKIISPDTLKNLTITNTSLKHYDGTRNRLVVDASEGLLNSPNGDNRFRANNNNIALIQGGSLRLVMGSSTSYLKSSDSDRGLWIKQASVALHENGKNRLWIDNAYSSMHSPNLTNYFKVNNSGVTLIYGESNRIKVDANYTNIYSPDGGNLNIGNAGVSYNGAVVQMSTHKGVANGIAELDASGIVITSQLPAYVDAIIEYASLTALQTADPQESNKVYITTDDNKIYRYTGTAGSYAEISSTIVLGTTSATAYRGDRGLIAYDHSQSAHDYEATNANIVKSVAGVLPTLDGSNLTNISVSGGNQLISPDTLKDLTLSDVNLMYQDSNYVRLYIDNTESRLTSPGGQAMLQVKDSDFNFDDGTRDRIEITAVHSKFFSPDGDYTLLDNSQYLYNDGTRNRLEINSTGAMLVSPGGSHSLIVGNTGVLSDGSEVITVADVNISNWDTAYGWGDHDGLYADLVHAHASIVSPDTLKDIIITNTDLRYNDGYTDRLWINDSLAALISQNGQHSLVVSDTGVVYDTVEIATVDDLHDEDKIISPDTLKNLTITNTSLIHNDGTTNRIEIDGTQTRIRGVGATPIYIKFGSSSFEINDGVDRFMSNSSKSVMAGANDVWWSACYDDRYEVMDATIARIQANATTTKLIAPDGISIAKIEDTSFEFNDGTRARILADAGSSRMYSTDGASYISVNNVGIHINHEAQPRITLTDSDSLFYSPNGSKWINIVNSEITLQGDTKITGSTTFVKDGETLKYQCATAGSKHYMAWYASNGTTREAWLGFGSSANYQFTIFNEKADNHIFIKTTGAGTVVLENIPTSSAGLPSGGLWKSGGYLRIV